MWLLETVCAGLLRPPRLEPLEQLDEQSTTLRLPVDQLT